MKCLNHVYNMFPWRKSHHAPVTNLPQIFLSVLDRWRPHGLMGNPTSTGGSSCWWYLTTPPCTGVWRVTADSDEVCRRPLEPALPQDRVSAAAPSDTWSWTGRSTVLGGAPIRLSGIFSNIVIYENFFLFFLLKSCFFTQNIENPDSLLYLLLCISCSFQH